MTLQRRALSALIAVLAGGLAAGCAHTPSEPLKVIETVEVKVPVPVPCKALERLGAEPPYADSNAALQAAPNIYEQVRLLMAGRAQRIQRTAEYVAAKSSCVF